MKRLRAFLGLLLFAVTAWPAAGAGEDRSLTAPKRSEATLPDRRKETPAPPSADTGSRRRGLDDTLEILGVQAGPPDAEGRRVVTVKVRYALISYAKGALDLGFTLKSATRFAVATHQEVERGGGDTVLTATIVPVQWPNSQPFKLSVGLSGEVRTNEWSLLAAVAQVMKPSAAPSTPPAK